MILTRVTIKNIKSFSGEKIFDFSESEKINTVSGINGSGKTTIFKSIILAQKIFFADQINRESDIYVDYSKDILTSFQDIGSFIKLEFKFANSAREISSFTIRCTEKTKEHAEVKLEGEKEDIFQIREFWNYKNPINLIIYIDSNRNISEEDFSNESIELVQQEQTDIAIEYISHPEKIFFSTYERLFRDYIRERIIPSTPRADLPHFVSKIFVHNILDYLKISNFTALERKDQFTLMIKTGKKKVVSYDMRNLSSGEKTLFYIYHFICYIKNIGMLIIDEPENNLHENMLSNFVMSLDEICNDENFSNLILRIAKKNKVPISESIVRQIKGYYKNHKLSQVFLLTHSKNLLYNNFTLGKNYIVNDGMQPINYDNYEKVLREVGLSKIINKVLFVEGKTENEILESILSPYNIKVKSLGGCSEVIETYKRYLSIEAEIRDVQFCFMIDRDTRTDADINNIRSKNEQFFDEHFIIMERHEIENYFLEAKMFHELYKKHKSSFNSIVVPTELELNNKIKALATSKKERVIRKKIQNLNQKSLSNIKLALSNKNIPVNSESEYDNYIDSVFDLSTLQSTVDIVKENYKTIDELNSSWDTDWLKLCDGKVVFNEFLSQVSSEIQVTVKRARKELEEIGLNSKAYEVNSIVSNILVKLS